MREETEERGNQTKAPFKQSYHFPNSPGNTNKGLVSKDFLAVTQAFREKKKKKGRIKRKPRPQPSGSLMTGGPVDEVESKACHR